MELTHPTRSSILSQYFTEIRNYELLTREEEQHLAREIRDGHQWARDQLVKCNLSFVAKVASEYRSFGIPFEDLLNEGNLGLIEAAQRFDPDKNNKFISYAIWWIRKSILKALAERSHVVRMPYSQIKKFKEIRKAEKELEHNLGRRPNREEISGYLSKAVNKVDRVLQYGVHEMSLDERVGDDEETPLSELLTGPDETSPEDRMIDRETMDGVGQAFCQLTDQQKTVLAYRYGVLGDRALTLQETGKRMGVSRERVRQIENQAKDRMRKLFLRKRRMSTPRRPAAAPAPRMASAATR